MPLAGRTRASAAWLRSLTCLVISVRLACRAEIFQVWRHVLTANLYAVVVSMILLVIRTPPQPTTYYQIT